MIRSVVRRGQSRTNRKLTQCWRENKRVCVCCTVGSIVSCRVRAHSQGVLTVRVSRLTYGDARRPPKTPGRAEGVLLRHVPRSTLRQPEPPKQRSVEDNSSTLCTTQYHRGGRENHTTSDSNETWTKKQNNVPQALPFVISLHLSCSSKTRQGRLSFTATANHTAATLFLLLLAGQKRLRLAFAGSGSVVDGGRVLIREGLGCSSL